MLKSAIKQKMALGLAGMSFLIATPVLAEVRPTPRLFTVTHPAMGTEFTLYLYSSSSAEAASISEEVFDEVDRIEQLLSNYRDSSELSRINRDAAKDQVTTDPEMFSFLQQSERWGQASNGAFDISVGRLMKAWGFFRHRGRIPSDTELQELRAFTGWQKIQLNPIVRTVHFAVPGIELDPGGIGKGFAVDAAVRIMRAQQVTAALLSAGGSTLYALGAPPHRRGWRIIVPGPLPSHRTLSVITLRDTSLSSADCSEKHFTLGGHDYCHIMDPQTMRPVEGRIQVSIVHPSATASDALSNAIFVEEPASSLRTLIHAAPDARALIVSGTADHPRCVTFRWSVSVDSKHCVL